MESVATPTDESGASSRCIFLKHLEPRSDTVPDPARWTTTHTHGPNTHLLGMSGHFYTCCSLSLALTHTRCGKEAVKTPSVRRERVCVASAFSGECLEDKKLLVLNLCKSHLSFFLPLASSPPFAPRALPLRHHQQSCSHKHWSAFNYREHQGRMEEALDRGTLLKH